MQGEEDLQYFSILKSLEEIIPNIDSQVENPENTESKIKEQKEDENIEVTDERKCFAILRIESMTTEEYKEYMNNRAVSIMHKNRQGIFKWLGLPGVISHNKVVIDLTSLIAKLTLGRIIEEAIKKRSPTNTLHIITKPLTVEEVKPLTILELQLLNENINHVIILK